MQLNMPGFEPPPPLVIHRAQGAVASRKSPSDDVMTQQRLIHGVLKSHGDMTVHEISSFCTLMAHEIGKRMSELFADGRATPAHGADGEPVTRKSPRGRASTVWHAT